jgi:hypothetical protein
VPSAGNTGGQAASGTQTLTARVLVLAAGCAALVYLRPYAAVPWGMAIGGGLLYATCSRRIPWRTTALLAAVFAAALVPWLLAESGEQRGAARDGARGHAHGPHAHGQLAAVAFSDAEPLLAEPLMQVVERLGASLVRAKGFVNVAGEPRRGFLERAGARTELRFESPWGGETPRTEIVFIGEGLDGDALRRQLWACRARRA